ncbi:MAG: hypothetical protein J6W52_01860 [Bacteroidaceae bacterium]|nr:hypothetical protein [Bacteroidaceae bacterium]
MRYFSLFIIAATSILVSLTSCKKNDYSSYPPTWKGFLFTRDGQEISRNNIYAGDVITVTAVQDEKGHLINATHYYWDIKAPIQLENGNYKDSVFLSKHIKTNYDGEDNGDPSVTFTIPEKALGNATVSFRATYNYSGNGIQVSDGGNYEDSGNLSGSIHSTSSSLSGDANGSVRFTIKSR